MPKKISTLPIESLPLVFRTTDYQNKYSLSYQSACNHISILLARKDITLMGYNNHGARLFSKSLVGDAALRKVNVTFMGKEYRLENLFTALEKAMKDGAKQISEILDRYKISLLAEQVPNPNDFDKVVNWFDRMSAELKVLQNSELYQNPPLKYIQVFDDKIPENAYAAPIPISASKVKSNKQLLEADPLPVVVGVQQEYYNPIDDFNSEGVHTSSTKYSNINNLPKWIPIRNTVTEEVWEAIMAWRNSLSEEEFIIYRDSWEKTHNYYPNIS